MAFQKHSIIQQKYKQRDVSKSMLVDLHIHSKYSRATSKDLSFENLEKYGREKGLEVLGTGDFTHPKQFEEINQLSEDEGILQYKSMHFVIQTEVSLIYSQNSKVRKVHLVLLSPSKYKTKEINDFLSKKGNLKADGRPIFGKYTLPEIVEDMKSIDNDIEIIPAHIWTPWFGVFGSKSGFDSLKEAFQDQAKHIHAIETGLSSDPLMNWRIKELDNRAIISSSDSHSFWPWRIGREATDLNSELSYKSIIKAIRHKKINSTIEVDPRYGKYHYDGHRQCNFSCSPKESIKLHNICPVCNKKLTLGVLHRVEDLATRSEEEALKHDIENKRKYFTLLPLAELISQSFGKGLETQFVKQKYNKLIQEFGNEYKILLETPIEEVRRIEKNEKFIRYMKLNRESKLNIKPGYDGVYGKIIDNERSLLDYFN